MPNKCFVKFENNPAKVCYSGQTFRGTVSLTLIKNVREVYLKIIGEAYARWSKSGGDGGSKSFIGQEEYIDERIYLFTSINGSYLKPGSYHYPFQSELPHRLPTSVEGKMGYIGYRICVMVDEEPFETPFTVIKTVDLNHDSSLHGPAIARDVRKIYPCCWLTCMESTPLKLIARTPVGGYVPGQTINLEITISNKSDQLVPSFQAQLIKQITYRSPRNGWTETFETIVLGEVETRGCYPHQDEVYKVNLKVPPASPSEDYSSIVKVRYFCRVIGGIPWYDDLMVNLPIRIGTIPIRDELEEENATTSSPVPGTSAVVTQQPTISQNPSAPPLSDQNDIAPSAPAPDSADEPPTYEEATGGSNERSFRPKYPVYKRQMSYAKN